MATRAVWSSFVDGLTKNIAGYPTCCSAMVLTAVRSAIHTSDGSRVLPKKQADKYIKLAEQGTLGVYELGQLYNMAGCRKLSYKWRGETHFWYLLLYFQVTYSSKAFITFADRVDIQIPPNQGFRMNSFGKFLQQKRVQPFLSHFTETKPAEGSHGRKVVGWMFKPKTSAKARAALIKYVNRRVAADAKVYPYIPPVNENAKIAETLVNW